MDFSPTSLFSESLQPASSGSQNLPPFPIQAECVNSSLEAQSSGENDLVWTREKPDTPYREASIQWIMDKVLRTCDGGD